jgi:hypothetical protein
MSDMSTAQSLDVNDISSCPAIQESESQEKELRKLEKVQLVQLQGLLKAVDEALLTRNSQLDESQKVRGPASELQELRELDKLDKNPKESDPTKLMDRALEELKRIEEDLAEAFGEEFGVDELLSKPPKVNNVLELAGSRVRKQLCEPAPRQI